MDYRKALETLRQAKAGETDELTYNKALCKAMQALQECINKGILGETSPNCIFCSLCTGTLEVEINPN